MKTVTAAIEIDAAPAEVWNVLTDLARYRDWNPLFVEATGDIAIGKRIMLRSKHPANGRLMTVKPKILTAEPGAQLRWASSLPGIMSGEHSFTLTAVNGGTRVVQGETFRGLLTHFSGKTFTNAGASFEALNQALKKRAETR